MTNIEIISWRLTLNLYIIRMCFNIIIINIIITATTLKQQSINQPTNQPINQSINQSTNQLVNPSSSQTNQNNQNDQINQSINQFNQPTNQPTHQQTNQSISRSVNHDICIYIHITQRFRGDNKCLDPFFRSPSYHEFSIRCQLGVPSPSIQPVTGQREMSHGRARHTAPEVQPVLIRIFPGSDQQDVDFT